jgi:hypothetical protein
MSQEIADYIELLEQQRATFLKLLDGLPTAALDWTPLPQDTSSISALIHHCATGLRWFVVEGLTGRPVPRDRAADFAAHGRDAAVLAGLVTAAFDDAGAALKSIDPALLDQARPIALDHPLNGQVHNPRFCLNWAIRHQAEHIGHISLTRQLWEAHPR